MKLKNLYKIALRNVKEVSQKLIDSIEFRKVSMHLVVTSGDDAVMHFL